jgi:putative lipase involved disintegration of autophagic bodies
MSCYTIYELARLSFAVYQRSGVDIAPWRRLQPFEDKANGFFGALFQNEDLNVLAFRGTDEGYDVVPDLLAFAGQVPNQYPNAERALRLARRALAPRAKLALTGQSLGGGLASLLGAKRGIPAAVFNAPGMSRSYAASLGLSAIPVFGQMLGMTAWMAADTDNIINIRATGDVVSLGTGPRLGRVQSVRVAACGLTVESMSPGHTARTAFVPELGTTSSIEAVALAKLSAAAVRFVLCQHAMLQMAQQLKNMAEYRKPLDWYRHGASGGW